ncbi:40S ribosomal protein S15 [Lacerta agilis]|nr:40S ribosomal protein S15 [Lacerta agilis]
MALLMQSRRWVGVCLRRAFRSAPGSRRLSRDEDRTARDLGLFLEETAAKMAEVEQKKKRTFRKFTYRGVDLDQLLDMSYEQLMQLYSARQRRRLNRGLRRKQHSLLKRLRKAKKEALPMEKPEVVKTHLRDMIILPEMVGSMVGVYNGKTFNQVEIKPEMIGHYLGEFSITYKPVKHGRPGIGATHSSRFIPLK